MPFRAIPTTQVGRILQQLRVLRRIRLSLDRATSVSTYLQALGVSAAQIKSVEGLGEANPVADNSTAAGKEQNRRVEVYMYASQEMIKAAENGTLN